MWEFAIFGMVVSGIIATGVMISKEVDKILDVMEGQELQRQWEKIRRKHATS